MGNGWVQRTRRSTVERVIERVHTDVDEMVPMRGGAGGHLHGGGGGGGGGGLVPHGGPGSNGWLNGELARQVHSKFEDMVRQSPAPTRAERSAYDELVRSFPPPESRGRLALGDGSAGARDPAEIVSPTGGYAAPWMNGGGGGGGDALGLGGDGRYPSRLGHSGDDAAGGADASGSPAERSIFSDLKSPPPSMRRASGGGGGSGSGFTLDDLILRKKGPDAAAARGAIFSPPPSPPGGRGRGRGRRGRKPGAGAVAKKPSPTPEPSELSSESEDADEDADADYVSPGGEGGRHASSPLEKLARAAEKRGATRAGASPRGVGKSPRSPASAAARAARRPHRIGDSDSDDDGNKIAAVRAGRAKPAGSNGGKRGSREARQLLIAAQRMARVTGGAGGVSGAVATATTPAAATPAARAAGTLASIGGRSGGRSTRERRAPSAFWLNEDAKRKDPFATTATAASAAVEPKKTAARAKPGPKPKPHARGRPKSKAKPAAKRRRDDDDDDDASGESSSSESESESEESEEEETLEERAARTSAVKKSAMKSPAKRPRGRSPTRGPTRARPVKKPSKSLAVYSESEDATDEEDEDEEEEEEDEEDDDVPPPKGDDDTEESDGDDTEESDDDSDDDTPLASRYKGKPPSKAAASLKGKKPPPAAKSKPSPKPAKPSPRKGNRRHSAEHAAALVSAEIMGRKTSMARRFGLNVARVVDSDADSSDDDDDDGEGEDGDDASPPGSTPTDRSSDRTEASSPATATTDGGATGADTTDADDTPATKGSGGQPPRSIEKGKRGGWRPGAGRPRKVYDPNDPTPRKRRRLPGEPPRKRGRPRKHPTAEDIEAGHIRRKPASAEEKAAALRKLAGGGLFDQDVATPKPRGRPRKDGSSKSAPPKPSGPDKKPRETPTPAVRSNAISTERWAARIKKAAAAGNAEASPDSPPRRREVSFPEAAAGAEPRDPASAPRSAPQAPSGLYGSDRENGQVSAAKSSRRKSILRTLGKSLGEENEREARRNAVNRRFSDVPEFEVFGFQGTPEKGGAASPDFGGSPGLFTAKSPGGLISQLDTDTPVTSPVRSSPRLKR